MMWSIDIRTLLIALMARHLWALCFTGAAILFTFALVRGLA